MTRPQAIARAREMHAGGWSIDAIRRYLAERGQPVAWERVKSWVDVEYDEQRKAKARVRMREAWREQHGVLPIMYRTPGDRDDLLLALRVDDGLSYGAIAAVARRLYGMDTNEARIRDELLRRGAKKNPNKSRAQRERTAA